MQDEEYITPRKTSELLKVTTRTLQTWDKEGKIKTFRTEGGQRRFLYSDVRKLMHPNEEQPSKRKIAYCRVSTPSQKEELETQAEFFRINYPTHEIVRDIGSGLNFKRKGFNSILDSAIKGDISEIVVTHKDRLCRFGFGMFERILQTTNGKILVLDKGETSPEKELVDDILSIITVFSSRLYGLKSHSIRKKIREATKNSEIPVASNGGGEKVSE